MAPQTEQTQIAVLATKMEGLTQAVGKLENKLDMYGSKFVTQEQQTSALESVRARIGRVEKVVYGVTTFIATAVGGLIYFAIQNYIFK